MKKIRFILLWPLLLTKRLYKKPAFLIILLLIPAVIFGYGLSAKHESGMMTIVLSAQAPEDSFSKSLVEELKNSGGLIRFIHEIDPDIAQEMVYNGVADAAWIVSADAKDDIEAFASGHYTGKGFVRVIVREETVPLLLANEKLSSSLFIRCAKVCFVNYMQQEESLPDDLGNDAVAEYFDGVSLDDRLFSYSYIAAQDINPNSKNYLLVPVRGILSIIVVICAMAAAMFYITDERDGLFSWVSLTNKPYVEFGCQIIAVGNCMLAAVISIFAAGMAESFLSEISGAILYILCCALFGQVLRIICRKQQVIGMLIPLFTMLMLIACPVFISVPALKTLSMLFPPTYYIEAIHNNAFMLYMVFYIMILVVIVKLFSGRRIQRL